jgi:toxin ParE1/3/4
MTQLIWTRRAIEDVQSIRQFIAQDSPHYAQLVTQRLVASVERVPALPSPGVSFQKSMTPTFEK